MNHDLIKFEVLCNSDPEIFWDKLMKENRWSKTYAVHAFEEYKKFIHLVCKYNRRVVPSKVVDTVWHLHMTFTQSYWNDFCKEVLNREVHHVPSPVNAKEQRTDQICYQATLKLYTHEFGISPATDVWGVKPKANNTKVAWYSIFFVALLTACTSTFNDDLTNMFKWLVGGFAAYKIIKWMYKSGGGSGCGSSSDCSSDSGSSCGGGCSS